MLAITSPQNHAAAGLLEKLGFRFDRMIRVSPDVEELRLFSTGP
jgi:RimJ/RimL family protein N-acetyltransferase